MLLPSCPKPSFVHYSCVCSGLKDFLALHYRDLFSTVHSLPSVLPSRRLVGKIFSILLPARGSTVGVPERERGRGGYAPSLPAPRASLHICLYQSTHPRERAPSSCEGIRDTRISVAGCVRSGVPNHNTSRQDNPPPIGFLHGPLSRGMG